MAPSQFGAYFVSGGLYYLLGLALFGLSLTILSKFAFGRSLLLKYPGIFSFGVFSKNGPTEEQMKATSFSDKFIGYGFTSKDSNSWKKPDYEIVASVTGPGMV